MTLPWHPSSTSSTTQPPPPPFLIGFQLHAPLRLQPSVTPFLQYGGHSDGFLLAEYGFVAYGGNEWNEVWLGEEVEALFEKLPAREKEKKRELLENEGYWG
jgi:hypothetical protein